MGAMASGGELLLGLELVGKQQQLVNQLATCGELKGVQVFASVSKEKENSVIKMQCPVCCR